MRNNNNKTVYSNIVEKKYKAPEVIFDTDALKWIEVITDEMPTEVGILGIVDELGDDRYLIRDIYFPKHDEANGATCEISASGSADLYDYLVSKGREEDAAKAKFWGHSHVNMGTSPSGQDETQGLELMETYDDFVIRAIFNKQGELSISFYDKKAGVRFDNIQWTTTKDSSDDVIRNKVKELININIPKAAPVTNSISWNGGRFFGEDDFYANAGHKGKGKSKSKNKSNSKQFSFVR